MIVFFYYYSECSCWHTLVLDSKSAQVFTADSVQAEPHLNEAPLSADAVQHAVKANWSVTHSRCSCCCVL